MLAQLLELVTKQGQELTALRLETTTLCKKVGDHSVAFVDEQDMCTTDQRANRNDLARILEIHIVVISEGDKPPLDVGDYFVDPSTFQDHREEP